MPPLPPLPPHPAGQPWPTREWPEADPAPGVDRARLEKAAGRLFAEPVPESHGETHALLVVQGGAIRYERYDREHEAGDTFISWSMAKSMLHAVVGMLVREGRMDPSAPAAVARWQEERDPRRAITLDQLLRMSSGLHFFEDYEDERGSDCLRMLFQQGKDDVAAYAEAQPLEHAPDTFWNYSSGTSNIVAALVRDQLGPGEATEAFVRRELFDKIGMTSAARRYDAAGTWIASSFVFASARDFARFGTLYLRDGVWEDERLLPEGWVDYARTETPASDGWYGAHWWLSLDGSGRFNASGYRGQYIAVDPARDLVMVRLGGSTPEQRVNVLHELRDVVEAFPAG